MSLGELFRTQKARWMAFLNDFRWKHSKRKQELDAECDLPPRRLSVEEARVLRWLLEHGAQGMESFLPQLDGMMAVRSCACGCPSIHLVVAADGPPAASRSNTLCDLTGETARGEQIGLLLFQSGGRLTNLEVYALPEQVLRGDSPEFGLPMIETLKPCAPDDLPRTHIASNLIRFPESPA